MESELDHVRRLILLRVEKQGLDLANASRAIGKNHAYLYQFINKGVPRRLSEETREKLARLLEIHPNALKPSDNPEEADDSAAVIEKSARLDLIKEELAQLTPDERAKIVQLAPGFADRLTPPGQSVPQKSELDFSNTFPLEIGRKDLPIYAAVKGSFEGTYIDMTQPVETDERPHYLVGVRDAFGILVLSDSMEPRFFQGETLYVNPHQPCLPGDFVVVEVDGHNGLVKRLKRRTAEYLELEQYNPPEVRRFPKAEIQAMCKVVGSKLR